ncbi:hypothetical protein ACWEIJ_20520 [Lentzea sp. NPDC004789]
MNKSPAGVAALLITGFGVVYAGGSAIAGWQPSAGWLIQAVIHLGELSAVVALARSGAAGRGRFARLGLAAAIAGQLLLAAAELIWPGTPGLADVLFGVAPILTGAGLITAGAATIRTKAWTGSSRLLPLALGLYTVLVLIPVMIGSGGPPAPLALWTIAGWDLLWFLLAARAVSRLVPGDAATAEVTVRKSR